MAVSTLKKISVNVKLNNGTDSEGNVRLVSVTLGNLSEENYDNDKALAVVTALAPCLSKTVSSIEKVEVSTLSAA
ncbi:MAG: hypothetical protein IJ587_12725 [Synergistaceae bacterium]|uniref:DUF1659 domain-containing protein n=1 Tax=Succinivibrio sp. TaxID=2053619 RepID=UPI0025DE8C0F|nr:hypothetical protein [Succinivibrio sp.]MBQ9222102.1 hypothetical protein [Succinivibrio sp.]MBR1439387.1 hypothetical protein [Synergistaceae bacterium]